MNFWNQLSWQHPWALALLLIPLTLSMTSYALHFRLLRAYADLQLLPWVIPKSTRWNARRLKNIAYVGAWVCFCVALAGPKIPVSSDQNSAIDVVVLVDTSRSMSATDVFPNRLQNAKIKLLELLENIKRARFSIVVFAARAHLFVPFTDDRNLLRHYISQIDSLVLPTQGSDFSAAIEFANQTIKRPDKPSFYILLSDGEYDKPLALSSTTPPIYTLGIGSVNGAGIPLDEGNWLEHDAKLVVSRLNESVLRDIATQSNGAYRRASNDGSDWKFIVENMESSLASLANVQQAQIEWDYLYHLPLFLALFLFFFACLTVKSKAVISKTLGITICLILGGQTSDAATLDEISAYKALQANNYQDALLTYQKIGGYEGHLGSGVTYYLSNKMYDAAKEFQQAVLSADNDHQRANAIYNLANTQFRLGDYEMAIQLYQNTLVHNPDFPSAQNNLKLAQTIWNLILKNLEQIELDTPTPAGSGPRERVSNMEEIQKFNNSLSIANEEKSKFALPSLPDLNKLIQQGMENFRIAGENEGRKSNSQRQHSIDAAKLAIKRIQINDPLLWKYLFEIEEGFPAPQPKPVEIPGVQPW